MKRYREIEADATKATKANVTFLAKALKPEKAAEKESADATGTGAVKKTRLSKSKRMSWCSLSISLYGEAGIHSSASCC